MTSRAAPPFARRATALTIAALVAVVEISVISLGTELLTRLVYRGAYEIDTFLSILLLFLLFGAIIAVPACLAVGLPLWYLAAHRGREKQRDAVRFGLAAGAVIGCFVAVLLSGENGKTLTPTALLMILLFSGAGVSTGWIAHHIGYGAG